MKSDSRARLLLAAIIAAWLALGTWAYLREAEPTATDRAEAERWLPGSGGGG